MTILFLFLILFILNIVLPTKPTTISGNVGKYTSIDILFYSGSESYNVDDYILYRTSSTQSTIIAYITEVNPDGTFKVISSNPEPIDDLDQNDLKQEQIIGKVNFSIPMYIFYPVIIIVSIILGFILTRFISKKIKTD